MSDIKARLKRLRKLNNMTLEQVAKQVCVSRQTIQRYESGVISNIPFETVKLLARALHTTPAYLIGWEDYPFQIKEIAEKEIEKRKSMTPIENTNIRLAQAMKKRNIEILELSQKTGISEKALNSYLSGSTRPSADSIYSISKKLEISQEWLMGYDVPMEAQYYSASYELSAEEECVIAIFRNLNKSGQDRLLEYSMELNEIPKYILKK